MHYHARDMAVVRARETKIPIVLASATPSVETEVNARRGRYVHLNLPERFGGQHLPSVEAIDLRREGPPRGRFISPRLAEAVKIALERRRAGAAVPQPPRLCAADAVQRLRLPHGLSELRRLAGRSSLQAAAGLPPLRLLDAAAGAVPEMRGEGQLRRGRSRRRAAGAGGGRAVSRRAHSRALQRSGRHRWSGCGRSSTTWRRAASTSSSAPSLSPRATIFRSSISSASSTPISASPTAIRAPPSARSNCCIRSSAAPAARRGAATAFCRPTSPSIR